MRTLLVRHAESVLNAAGYAQGQFNPPLSEQGREQAATLAEDLASVDLEQVYSSPLQRAYRTAERIASHQPCGVRLEPNLAAADLGAAAGLPRDTVTDIIEEAHAEDEFWTPASGEDPDAFVDRVTATIKELSATHTGDICIVSHGGPIRTFIAHCRGDPVTSAHSIPQDNCAVTVYKPADASIEQVNVTPASMVLK